MMNPYSAENLEERAVSRPFFMMAKPVSSACNLACRYCYYLNRPDVAPSRRMDAETLEVLIRDVIAAQPGVPEIHFAWQGGEPTLAGIDFFLRAVALQERYCPAGTTVVNAIQTNGTLLDAQWAEFFAAHRFLVGISIDGPEALHDPLRRDARKRTTHAKVLRGLRYLQEAQVQYNALTVVHHMNYRQGRAVYRFLRRIGVRHMQFIPLVERFTRDNTFAAPPPGDPGAAPAPWTAPSEGFGEFLCAVFDEWLANDVGGGFRSGDRRARGHAREPARGPVRVRTRLLLSPHRRIERRCLQLRPLRVPRLSPGQYPGNADQRAGALVSAARIRARQNGRPALAVQAMRVSCSLLRRLPQAPLRRDPGRRTDQLPLPVVPALLLAHRAGACPVRRDGARGGNQPKNGS